MTTPPMPASRQPAPRPTPQRTARRSARRTAPPARPGPTPEMRPVDGFTRHIMNPLVAWLVRRGIGVGGARVLTVPGRRSGLPRTAVVNLLEHEGSQYVLAPRGRTEWVQNIRSASAAEVRRGRRCDHLVPVELDLTRDGAEMLTVLRAYLDRWGWQVRPLLDGARADDPDEVLVDLLPRVPMFRLIAH